MTQAPKTVRISCETCRRCGFPVARPGATLCVQCRLWVRQEAAKHAQRTRKRMAAARAIYRSKDAAE